MAIKINAAKLRTKLKAKLKKAGSEPFSYKYNEGIGTALEILEDMNRKAINKGIKKEMKKEKNNLDKPHKVTEFCNYCENAVTLYWDTKHDGYDIYCPCCGKKMKLSSALYSEVSVKALTDNKES